MIPTRIGQRVPGGHFAGINRIKNSVYAVVVSPKWTERKLQWKTVYTHTVAAQSVSNGRANTIAMDSAEHLAAQYCLGLVVDGCNDFYLPSTSELDLCYQNLKPGTSDNCSKPNTMLNSKLLHYATRSNTCSIPPGAPHSTTNPAQTIVTAFVTGCVDAFNTTSETCYWVSTEPQSAFSSMCQSFTDGTQHWASKTGVRNVRAVRGIYINFE